MPQFSTVRPVAFTPKQMFDLVADVERYPQFVPMCEALHVVKREQRTDRDELIATMSIGYKAIHESFTTRVSLFEPEHKVLVEYLDGPFSHLENRWQFVATSGGCDVHFHIAYEFRSKMLGLLMGALFDKAFRRFAEAFEERAADIYGRPRAGTPTIAPAG